MSGNIIDLHMSEDDILEFLDIDYAYNNSELIIFIHDLVDACSDKEIYLRLMILCKIKKLDVKRVYLDLSNSNSKLYEVLFKCIKWEHDVDTIVNISADKKNIDKVKVRKRMEKLIWEITLLEDSLRIELMALEWNFMYMRMEL